jgi:hypothetical protein
MACDRPCACLLTSALLLRSSWMPGSSAPTLAEHRNAFVRLWKKKGFKEERMTTVGLCVIGTSTTLASNKSHVGVSSPRRESSPTTFVRGAVAIGYNYPLWPATHRAEAYHRVKELESRNPPFFATSAGSTFASLVHWYKKTSRGVDCASRQTYNVCVIMAPCER